jgi:hypothetical protein
MKPTMLKMSKLPKLMTNRERAEMLVEVVTKILRLNKVKISPVNIRKSVDWAEGRYDMGAEINDALLFKLEDKLKGKWSQIKKNPVLPRKGESERKFVSRCMSEEKESFPKQKQRIAVCLSKARKNPLLESGATISRNSGINRRAASMT